MGSTVIALEAKDGQHLSVERSIRHEETPEFFVSMTDRFGSYFTKEDAPALALAVLEAAGYVEPDGRAGNALFHLRVHRDQQAEAKEQEALNKEAKAIYEAYGKATPYAMLSWEGLNEGREPWRTVARKAREIHAAKESAK